MTFQAGFHPDRDTLAGMAILAALRVWLMQYISYESWLFAAMRIMAGTAVAGFCREIPVFLLH